MGGRDFVIFAGHLVFKTLYIFSDRDNFGGPKRSVPKIKSKNISLGPIVKWVIIYHISYTNIISKIININNNNHINLARNLR